MKLAILGAGAWGTALAVTLAPRHAVSLWMRDAARADAVGRSRRNERYLPEVAIPEAVTVSADLDASLAGADACLVATPMAALRGTLAAVHARRPGLPVLCACKGFERDTGLLPHQVGEQELGRGARTGVLSGPSFALEVAKGLPAALTVASADAAFAREMALALHQSTFRVYYCDDPIGVEVGGAVKNVMAIATGICDGLALGMNARAALVTRGLAEIIRLGTRMGGRAETFMGLTGAGDLILTCTGDLSRNRQLGLELARGRAIAEILRGLGHVAEGFESANEVLRTARRLGVDMPITEAVCAVLSGALTPRAAVDALLARDPREEC